MGIFENSVKFLPTPKSLNFSFFLFFLKENGGILEILTELNKKF
jgi:hypothetical protein